MKQKDDGTEMTRDGIARAASVLAEQLRLNFFAKDEYIPLSDRLSQFIEEPDKKAGFVFVGNDTWQPKHLVNARNRQQRKVASKAETGVVWTRR